MYPDGCSCIMVWCSAFSVKGLFVNNITFINQVEAAQLLGEWFLEPPFDVCVDPVLGPYRTDARRHTEEGESLLQLKAFENFVASFNVPEEPTTELHVDDLGVVYDDEAHIYGRVS